MVHGNVVVHNKKCLADKLEIVTQMYMYVRNTNIKLRMAKLYSVMFYYLPNKVSVTLIILSVNCFVFLTWTKSFHTSVPLGKKKDRCNSCYLISIFSEHNFWKEKILLVNKYYVQTNLHAQQSAVVAKGLPVLAYIYMPVARKIWRGFDQLRTATDVHVIYRVSVCLSCGMFLFWVRATLGLFIWVSTVPLPTYAKSLAFKLKLWGPFWEDLQNRVPLLSQ